MKRCGGGNNGSQFGQEQSAVKVRADLIREEGDHIWTFPWSQNRDEAQAEEPLMEEPLMEVPVEVTFAGMTDRKKGGSKHKSRKAKKTKKRRGSHEGGKKKCPKHCRRHTRRTRKGLKHRKN